MSGDVTIQALKRQTFLPDRSDAKNGTVIAGQDYDDVYFTGGTANNITLNNPVIVNPVGVIPVANGGTGANLSATGGTSQVLKQTSVGGVVAVAQLAASDLSDGTTGSGAVVLATSPTLVTPALGTPTALVGTNITGTAAGLTAGAVAVGGITGLGTGVSTFLATPSSANLKTAVTDETGSGALVFATSPTLVTPVLGAASATSLSFSSTTGIIGTATNDAAAAGSVGEIIVSDIATGSAVSLATGVTANVTFITLPAGDWLVWGNVFYNAAGTTTVTSTACGVSDTSLTFVRGATRGSLQNWASATAVTGFAVDNLTCPVHISTTGQDMYLLSNCNFGVSTLSAYGFIMAQRIR